MNRQQSQSAMSEKAEDYETNDFEFNDEENDYDESDGLEELEEVDESVDSGTLLIFNIFKGNFIGLKNVKWDIISEMKRSPDFIQNFDLHLREEVTKCLAKVGGLTTTCDVIATCFLELKDIVSENNKSGRKGSTYNKLAAIIVQVNAKAIELTAAADAKSTRTKKRKANNSGASQYNLQEIPTDRPPTGDMRICPYCEGDTIYRVEPLAVYQVRVAESESKQKEIDSNKKTGAKVYAARVPFDNLVCCAYLQNAARGTCPWDCQGQYDCDACNNQCCARMQTHKFHQIRIEQAMKKHNQQQGQTSTFAKSPLSSFIAAFKCDLDEQSLSAAAVDGRSRQMPYEVQQHFRKEIGQPSSMLQNGPSWLAGAHVESFRAETNSGSNRGFRNNLSPLQPWSTPG